MKIDLAGALNSLHGGKGARVFTDAGWDEFMRRSRAAKKERGIHWRRDCRDEEWHLAIERQLFAPEYEGVYWGYATAVSRG